MAATRRRAAATAAKAKTSLTGFPDGIDDNHARGRGGLHKIPNVLSILVLGAIVAAALLGLFGGGKSPPVQVTTADATLTVTTPQTMRSGLFFETRITVAARRPIADVVIALPPALWRDQTINTTIPGADKEEGADGSFRFHYGALKSGETLEIKYDGQINPPLFAGTRGSIALLDGERPLADVPLNYRVWP